MNDELDISSVDGARKFLRSAGVFFDADDGEDPKWAQMLNMNDQWGWACSEGEFVPDDKLPEVARLFWRYGFPGLLYWYSEQNGQCRSEFQDNNRFVDFVRHEERLRQEVPSSNERAYKRLSYTLGGEP